MALVADYGSDASSGSNSEEELHDGSDATQQADVEEGNVGVSRKDLGGKTEVDF